MRSRLVDLNRGVAALRERFDLHEGPTLARMAVGTEEHLSALGEHIRATSAEGEHVLVVFPVVSTFESKHPLVASRVV